MIFSNNLIKVFKSSEEVLFDDTTQFILFSDCHRGDNSWADDFANNQNIFFHALNFYYDQGFSYIELGDGDELWENPVFEDIRKSHSHVFWKLSEFHKNDRLYLIWGNHNRMWKNPKNVEKHLYQYYDEREDRCKPLFKDIKIHEGLILKHRITGKKIFLTHGHQVDVLNNEFWWFGRFVVKNIWKHLQRFGIKDPTNPSKNFRRRKKVEKDIITWARVNKQPVIAGHTHRPVFPDKNELYFNTGSCVHPRCITGIEIANGEISLIKWFIDVKPGADGFLFINKEVLEGPKKI